MEVFTEYGVLCVDGAHLVDVGRVQVLCVVLCIVCVFAAVFTEPVFLLVPENVLTTLLSCKGSVLSRTLGPVFVPDCKFNACANSVVYESTKYIQVPT